METKTITIKQMRNKIRELQILDFAQFLDVLDVIDSYKNIEEIKVDIAMRKELLKETIEDIRKNVE